MKTRLLLALALLLTTAVIAFLQCRPTTSPTLKNTTSSNERLAPLLEYLAEHKTSGSLLIANGDQIAEELYWTWDSARVDAESVFQLASLSKQFTGFLILELIREGKLRESQIVREVIGETHGTSVGNLKIIDLLSMTSGLAHSEAASIKLRSQLLGKQWTSQEVIEELKNYHPLSHPGDRFLYSNLGYVVLAQVVERVENQSFESVLKRRIFDPFGMEKSYLDIDGKRSERLVRGYMAAYDRWIPLPTWNYSFIKGASGIVSNVRDLHKWLTGLKSFFGCC